MGQDRKDRIVPEWSRKVNVSDIDAGGVLRLHIEPDSAARARLVQRLGLLSLDDLEADVILTRDPGQMKVHVQGHLEARVRQNCVVTLEPVEDSIAEDFESWFADPEQAVTLAKARHDRLAKRGQRELPVLDERDDPEPIVNGRIDVGELVTQYLSLAINPFPHAKGVEFEVGDEETRPAREILPNPFAALKNWKLRQGWEED